MNHYLVKMLFPSGEIFLDVFEDSEEQASVLASHEWPEATFISVKLVWEGK